MFRNIWTGGNKTRGGPNLSRQTLPCSPRTRVVKVWERDYTLNLVGRCQLCLNPGLICTGMADGHVKEVLEKEITCPLCLEIFKDPKKLPCESCVLCGMPRRPSCAQHQPHSDHLPRVSCTCSNS